MGVTTIYIIYFYPIKKNRVYYSDFGIYIPSGYNIHGIDVSHYQRSINWELVKNMKKKIFKSNLLLSKQQKVIIRLMHFSSETGPAPKRMEL